MGDGFVRGGINEALYLLNARFGPGEPLKEMVIIQKDFQVFSGQYSLKQVYRLLRIFPSDPKERRLFYMYLDNLKNVQSDIPGMSGHDRIIKARRENLESKTPLPSYTQTHLKGDNPGVSVSEGRPMAHDRQIYQMFSIPTELPKAAE